MGEFATNRTVFGENAVSEAAARVPAIHASSQDKQAEEEKQGYSLTYCALDTVACVESYSGASHLNTKSWSLW